MYYIDINGVKSLPKFPPNSVRSLPPGKPKIYS